VAPGKSAVVLTPDALLEAGADVVAAYSNAVDEAKHLARVDSWIASTRELSSHTGDKDPALRILRPASIVQLAKLDSA